jgi:hypothetical protein
MAWTERLTHEQVEGGEVLHWQVRRPSSPHYVDNEFCMVLEESEDMLVAVFPEGRRGPFSRLSRHPLNERVGGTGNPPIGGGTTDNAGRFRAC